MQIHCTATTTTLSVYPEQARVSRNIFFSFVIAMIRFPNLSLPQRSNFTKIDDFTEVTQTSEPKGVQSKEGDWADMPKEKH